MKALSPNAALRALFRGELRYILRDPLALVLMLVVPVLAYPALFFGMDAMQGANAEKAETRELTIAGPPELAAWLLPGDALRVVDAAGPEAETADATLILPDGPGKGAVLHYRGDKRDGRNARDRLREVLERQRSRDQADAWASQGLTVQPDTLVALTWEDQATEAARAGAALGRILPLMLVFLVLSGGLYTALDLIAGEKERGTLETILTTRVARREVLRAKFLVVLLSTAAISLLALATLSASAMTGHFRLPGSETAIRFGPETAALAALLILPLVVELSALMVAAASFATDYRSGQAMSLPLMLVVLAPAAVPAISGLESGLAVGLLPITGVAVALRDALTGELSLGLGAWAFCWAAVHAGGALFLAEKLVGRESVLLGGGSARARYAKGRYHVEALALYAVVLLIFWFFGQLMQQRDLALGLLASQLLLIALPALATVALLARPWRPTLRLRWPHPADFALGIVAGCAAPGLGQLVADLQATVLPVPEEALQQFAAAMDVDLGLLPALLLFALLPAVCEELLFRGTLLGLLERSLPRWAQVVVVGLLFGLLHLMIFRILPTGALGMVFTAAALASGSLLVPLSMHLLNNGLLVAGSELGWLEDAGLPMWQNALLALICIGAVAAMGRIGRRSPDPSGP